MLVVTRGQDMYRYVKISKYLKYPQIPQYPKLLEGQYLVWRMDLQCRKQDLQGSKRHHSIFQLFEYISIKYNQLVYWAAWFPEQPAHAWGSCIQQCTQDQKQWLFQSHTDSVPNKNILFAQAVRDSGWLLFSLFSFFIFCITFIFADFAGRPMVVNKSAGITHWLQQTPRRTGLVVFVVQ